MTDIDVDNEGRIVATVFGRSCRLHPRTILELKELEATGRLTMRFAISEEDAEGNCVFGVFRVELTPREIYQVVDCYVRGELLDPDVEAVYCGNAPWRYTRVSPYDAELWISARYEADHRFTDNPRPPRPKIVPP